MRAGWNIPCKGIGSFFGCSISVHAWLVRLSAKPRQNLALCRNHPCFMWETDQWLSYKDLIYKISSLPIKMNMDVGAWTDGLIVTRSMRLADFLEEVGRYRHGYLGRSTEIAILRLPGVFRLEDTDKLLAILPQMQPVQVRCLHRYQGIRPRQRPWQHGRLQRDAQPDRHEDQHGLAGDLAIFSKAHLPCCMDVARLTAWWR